MAKRTYYAVVFVYDANGSLRVEMPCFEYKQVMFCSARHEEVRVVLQDGRAFKLRLKQEERDKYPLPEIDDTPLEWMRDYGENQQCPLKVDPPEHTGPQSDVFYDPWKAVKKGRQW